MTTAETALDRLLVYVHVYVHDALKPGYYLPVSAEMIWEAEEQSGCHDRAALLAACARHGLALRVDDGPHYKHWFSRAGEK